MRILTFDTSLDKLYVTVGEDSQLLATETISNNMERYNSAYLIPTIISLLKELKLTMQDINVIGVNIGPGSFTGLRASVTVARIMAQNLDIPVVGVSSLQIISLLNDTDKNSLCLIDARKNKAYTGIYTSHGDTIQEPQALEYDKVIELAKSGNYFVIAESKMTEMFEKENIEALDFQKSNANLGMNLLELTNKALKQENQEKFRWYNLKPLYIQPPSITLSKRTAM